MLLTTLRIWCSYYCHVSKIREQYPRQGALVFKGVAFYFL